MRQALLDAMPEGLRVALLAHQDDGAPDVALYRARYRNCTETLATWKPRPVPVVDAMDAEAAAYLRKNDRDKYEAFLLAAGKARAIRIENVDTLAELERFWAWARTAGDDDTARRIAGHAFREWPQGEVQEPWEMRRKGHTLRRSAGEPCVAGECRWCDVAALLADGKEGDQC